MQQQQRLEALLHLAWSNTDYDLEVLDHCGAVRNGKISLDRFNHIP